GHGVPLLRADARGRDPVGRHRRARRGRAPVGEPAWGQALTSRQFLASPADAERTVRGSKSDPMTALVLVHAALDVSAELELGDGGRDDRRVGQRGGDRIVVVARADRAALEWALTLADRAIALTLGPPEPPESEDVLAWARGRGAARTIRVSDAAL